MSNKPLIPILKSTLDLVLKYPRILYPFMTIGAIQIGVLLLLFLTPRTSLASLIGPPIRTFFGEGALHYPKDLLILPRMFQTVQIPIDIFLGPLMIGCMILWIAGLANRKNASESWMGTIPLVGRKYLQMLLFTVGTYYIVKYSMVGMKYLLYYAHVHFPNKVSVLPRYSPLIIMALFNFFIGGLIEFIFIFVFPALLLENRGIFTAVKRSLQLVRNNFTTTLLIVIVPLFLFFIVSSLRNFIPALVHKTGMPEISFWILLVSIFFSIGVNSFVTAASTILFIIIGREDSGRAA